MTTLHPTPTRWHDMWLYLGILYSEDEMLERFDYVGGVWHERIEHVEPLTPRVKDRYLAKRTREAGER